MGALEIAYWVCFIIGVGYAVVSGLMAGVFSGGAEAHVDVGGSHVDLGHGAEGAVHFPLLSPVTIAAMVGTFGGAGLIFKKVLLWPTLGHVSAAAACAIAAAFAVAWLLWRVFSLTQGSSEGRAEDAIGTDAEITIGIPNHGLGEIAYILKESRYTNPARSEDGKELPAGVPVRIMRLDGNTYVVRKKE